MPATYIFDVFTSMIVKGLFLRAQKNRFSAVLSNRKMAD